MKYEILEINKYNGTHTNLEAKTIREAKIKVDFNKYDVWIRQISKTHIFHWRKLKNKSEDFYRAKRAKEFENEWLTKLYNNEIVITF